MAYCTLKAKNGNMIHKFYLNLDRSPDRRKYFDNTWIRFKASDGKEMTRDEPLLTRMISQWNISPDEHLAKCGCFQSHYNMLSHIATNKLNKVIVVEDDAVHLSEVYDDEGLYDDEDLLRVLSKCKNFTYLGGAFANVRMYKGFLKQDEWPEPEVGINELDKSKMRILMTLAYYIPHWTIARDIVEFLDSQSRVRAIDVMLYKIIKVPQDYHYPAIYCERGFDTTIHKKSRKKNADEYYGMNKPDPPSIESYHDFRERQEEWWQWCSIA